MAGTEIMRIANLSEMEAKVDVNENDINRLVLGDTANIEVDAFHNRKFKAVVYQIGSSSNSISTSNTADQVTDFTVRIKILPNSYADLIKGKGSDAPFKPGLSTSVEIQTKKAYQVLSIPVQAVTTRIDSSKVDRSKKNKDNSDNNELNKVGGTNDSGNSKEIVFVYQAGTVKLVHITSGIQDQFHIQVLKGLKEGDEVVIAPNLAVTSQLKDGQKVKKVDLDELSFTDKK